MSKSLKFFIQVTLSGGGVGYLPGAPGTWGSLVGVPLGVWFTTLEPWAFPLGLLAVILWGTLASQWLLRTDPSLGEDPSFIVMDEIAGLLLTYYGIWCCNGSLTLLTGALGFLLFRGFDIVKPFPIDWLEKRWGSSPALKGFSVMIDDLAAAIPATILTLLGDFLFHQRGEMSLLFFLPQM